MTIDFSAIRDATDLLGMLSQACGPPRNGKFLCPFHDDHSPSLSIGKDGQTWKCWACGEHGDAVDFIAKLDRVPVADAARSLGGTSEQERSSRAKTLPRDRPKKPPAYLDPAWQATVDALICEAEANLRDRDGRDVRDYLHSRGIDDRTIGAFRLGYLPTSWESPIVPAIGKPIFANRGVLVPWLAPARGSRRRNTSPPARISTVRAGSARTFGDSMTTRSENGTRNETAPNMCASPDRPEESLILFPTCSPRKVRLTVWSWRASSTPCAGVRSGWAHPPHRDRGRIDSRACIRGVGVLFKMLPPLDRARRRRRGRRGRGALAQKVSSQVRPERRVPFGKDFTGFVQQGGDANSWLDSIRRQPISQTKPNS